MIGVIIAGGGGGTRLDGQPKAFLKVAGKELIYYSLDLFHNEVDEIVIVLPLADVKKWKPRIENGYKNVKVVSGGQHRQDSIRNGLKAFEKKNDIVFVHDVARPFLTLELFKRIKEGAEKYGACIPYVGACDTLKEVNNSFVGKTLDRDRIVQIQTPQAFKIEVLQKAYFEAYKDNFYGSDDSILVERIGIDVYMVEGERKNIKITYPVDLLFAETILKNEK